MSETTNSYSVFIPEIWSKKLNNMLEKDCVMLQCVNRNLRNNGTLYFLFQTTRLNEVLKVLNEKKLVVKKMQFVYDENKENSTVVMLKAVKGAKEGVLVQKPRYITR